MKHGIFIKNSPEDEICALQIAHDVTNPFFSRNYSIHYACRDALGLGSNIIYSANRIQIVRRTVHLRLGDWNRFVLLPDDEKGEGEADDESAPGKYASDEEGLMASKVVEPDSCEDASQAATFEMEYKMLVCNRKKVNELLLLSVFRYSAAHAHFDF
ncbi:hypothetical protein AVEN_102801-1 [Araneus ventricosus]|uniref:Uncharacterized protein n=1 Tax=Araneus ventricosus TaxID=182803 RepID=A0A4Y2IK05_ARAVE|nr:hypothetical protein AVEN_102801-1 [Araneus ventricosus]